MKVIRWICLEVTFEDTFVEFNDAFLPGVKRADVFVGELCERSLKWLSQSTTSLNQAGQRYLGVEKNIN